ncbi:amino acid transporter [Kocuria sp. CNJ-770]|uniref:LysE/ArgO family amino acid transporter n=1 Tax=Kocuria oceani TaxID=988827 RepID=A0ABV9TLR2_9MICC|nr:MULTISPECIES: LysE/ArgO family amino acid transporter [Kocuria]OLT11082.1 amino acid transporter [Kocuria sp. CNJ-770]
MSPAAVLGPALLGLGSGLALIVAIGAQNAFVLRQGLRRQFVGTVVALCAVSDLILIAASVAGTSLLEQVAPWLMSALRWAGAVFLLGYGLLAARRALRPAGGLVAAGAAPPGRGRVALTALALTWLNPHVYVDTVLVMGSLANAQGEQLRWWFAAGAMTASVLWFGGLGWGATRLQRFFASPVSWRVLDGSLAVLMLVLGLELALGA